MGYRITYGMEAGRKESDRGGRRFFLTAVFFLCFLWMVSVFWPEGRELLKILLIPGDPDETLRAAEVFAQELGSGFSLTDAAQNFCIAVLEHGYSG